MKWRFVSTPLEHEQVSNGLASFLESEAEAEGNPPGPSEEQRADEEEDEDEVDLGDDSEDVSVLCLLAIITHVCLRILKLSWNPSLGPSTSGELCFL